METANMIDKGTYEDTTYNGWANRATWLVNLHLTNDQGLYEDAVHQVRSAFEYAVVPDHVRGVTTDYQWKLGRATDALRDHVEALTQADGSALGIGVPLLVADLVNQALADVDWREIAEGLLEE